jgi:Na+-translocating ferredoxin:NAD+ oxidoreductase RnfA subunit
MIAILCFFMSMLLLIAIRENLVERELPGWQRKTRIRYFIVGILFLAASVLLLFQLLKINC